MGSSLGRLRWQQDMGAEYYWWHRAQDVKPVTGSRETPGSASSSISSGHNSGARVICEQTEGSSISLCGGATPMLGTTDVNKGLYSSEKLIQQYEASGLATAAAEGIRQLPEELSARLVLQLHSASSTGTDGTAARTGSTDIGRMDETSSYKTASAGYSRQGSLAIDAATHVQETAAVVAPTAGSCERSPGHTAVVDDSAAGRYSDQLTRGGTGDATGTPHSTGGTSSPVGIGGAAVVQLAAGRSSASAGKPGVMSGGIAAGNHYPTAGQIPAGEGTSGGTASTAATLEDVMIGSSSVVASSSATNRGPSSLWSISGTSALLKARSDMAVLRDLKIGPMLGRGTYSRVYKGRWKAGTVAVKVIEHSDKASVAGMDSGRESLLATSLTHPNVVPTYHTSTMTVSQRNALANTWLQEGATTSSNGTVPVLQSTADDDLANVEKVDARASSSYSGLAEQEDILETWMLMEYCEKGSLDRAINQGRFVGQDGRPDMIGIYKALYDTAQGLDYLHSIGVIHGDLKAANVLLKGSTRDMRGFACKIKEFAFSRVLDLDATHISTQTYGTLVYMPSELLLDGQMTQATDMYSFGLMMWELYTSTRVFKTEFDEGVSIARIFCMIAYQRWRPAIPPDCPPGFAALMAACWNEDPEQRPTAQQLLRSLQSLYMADKKAMAENPSTSIVAPHSESPWESTGVSSDSHCHAGHAAGPAAAAIKAVVAAISAALNTGAGAISSQQQQRQQQQQQLFPFTTNPAQTSVSFYQALMSTGGVLKLPSGTQIPLNVDFNSEIRPHLGRLLGRGGFGHVYEGLWKGKMVAVKLLIVSIHDDDILDAFLKEIAYGACLRGCDRIVKLLGACLAGLGGAAMTSSDRTGVSVHDQAAAHAQKAVPVAACQAPPTASKGTDSSSSGASRAGADVSSPFCLQHLPDTVAITTAFAAVSQQQQQQQSQQQQQQQQDPPQQMALIMELMEGGSLQTPKQRLTYLEILQVAQDITAGLAYLHPVVVHRDLKPHNVLLDKQGRAAIADFGISRFKDTHRSYLSITHHGGTANYMAPELFSETRVDEAADVYSLGCILYECLARKQPFDNLASDGNVLYQIIVAVAIKKERPVLPPGTPPRLASLIHQCWLENPAQRPRVPQIAAELQDMIQEELACHSVGPGTSPPAATSSSSAQPSTSSQHL